jgi:hypothetical protein
MLIVMLMEWSMATITDGDEDMVDNSDEQRRKGTACCRRLIASRVDSLLQEDQHNTALLLVPSSGPGVVSINDSVNSSGESVRWSMEDRERLENREGRRRSSTVRRSYWYFL